MSGSGDLSQFSMHGLFRIETENQAALLSANLLELERGTATQEQLDACMRAAHSLKGAARIVEMPQAVMVAHAMEDVFEMARRGRLALTRPGIDLLLHGVDLLMAIAAAPGAGAAALTDDRSITDYVAALGRLLLAETPPAPPEQATTDPDVRDQEAAPGMAPEPAAPAAEAVGGRMVRVSADSLNRLLGLAGEHLMEAEFRRLLATLLQQLKRGQAGLDSGLGTLRASLSGDAAANEIAVLRDQLQQCQELVAKLLGDLDALDRRAFDLANRLYDETLSCRMQPFEDGVTRYGRLVRDIGHDLGKQARLVIAGGRTNVDRDIFEHIDAPLVHLLRNAVDHGIETADERLAAGKPAEGIIRLEARHSAGFLLIQVEDDGRGIDLEQLRRAVVARHLAAPEAVAAMSELELTEFLFLPGFTMRDVVTEISGRGVGLDAVKAMIKQVHGVVRVHSEPGCGTRFQMQLPLALSLVRSLLVEVDGEPYGIPLVGVVKALMVPQGEIAALEGKPYFQFGERQVGLVSARQVFGRGEAQTGAELPVVVLGDTQGCYGLVVDRFLGQRELAIHRLDPRLGKIKDITAASIMEDGSPVLIIDPDDMVRSIEKLAASGRVEALRQRQEVSSRATRKRVLVVDDSLTVRELERKLLQHHGYEVGVAVDGMDGWNAVRDGHFDLVVTDVDMPRMDGIELVTMIKQDARLRDCPVMIVSYKDREVDRRRGLDAGADHYLAKGSFHDTALIDAVVDLIGPAEVP
jgi:two-component system, chemotaxis family, sensor histidine kinase and response regulator WspE